MLSRCRGYLGAASAVDSLVCFHCNRGDDESNLMICSKCAIQAQHAQCAGFAKVSQMAWACVQADVSGAEW